MLDVLIIGSGPAGLSAAVYAKRENLEVMVLEKQYLGIGQIADSLRVDNYLGYFGKNGYDLGMEFRTHATQLQVPFEEGNVTSFRKTHTGWIATLADGKQLEAKTVIYAAGATYRKLGVQNEDKLIGRGISFCAACDGAFYKDKIVAVVGGGDTALDDATHLSEICKRVYLIHRRNTFAGARSKLQKLQQLEQVEIITGETIARIEGQEKVQSIVLQSGRLLEVDGIFEAVGMNPNTEILAGLIELAQGGYIQASESGITSAEGFFAAGDVRTKPLRQVITAVSDGAYAAMSAAAWIRQTE